MEFPLLQIQYVRFQAGWFRLRYFILTVDTGSYPFQTNDPFVMQSCPHLFFTGNQPRFKTATIEGDAPLKLSGEDTEMGGTEEDSSYPTVRLVSIPKFRESGELVLVDTETLEVEVVKFGAFAGKEEKQ